MLSNIRIVLVETSHPGNIGAVARAMKNMCLSDLALVAPREFPSAEATARASGADDLLAEAQLTATLDEAIKLMAWHQLDKKLDDGQVAKIAAFLKRRPLLANLRWISREAPLARNTSRSIRP